MIPDCLLLLPWAGGQGGTGPNAASLLHTRGIQPSLFLPCAMAWAEVTGMSQFLWAYCGLWVAGFTPSPKQHLSPGRWREVMTLGGDLPAEGEIQPQI